MSAPTIEECIRQYECDAMITPNCKVCFNAEKCLHNDSTFFDDCRAEILRILRAVKEKRDSGRACVPDDYNWCDGCGR